MMGDEDSESSAFISYLLKQINSRATKPLENEKINQSLYTQINSDPLFANQIREA